MKPSETIKQECCGNHYNTLDGKQTIVNDVRKLETQVKVLNWMVRFQNSKLSNKH